MNSKLSTHAVCQLLAALSLTLSFFLPLAAQDAALDVQNLDVNRPILRAKSNNGTERFTILDNGNTGIGVANPLSTLQLNGGIRARGGVPGFLGVLNNGYAFSGNSGDNDSGMFSSADGQLEFYGNGFEAMRVSPNNSYIGIGTTTPTERLHVNGNIRLVDEGNIMGIDKIIGHNNLIFQSHSNSGINMYIAPDGNVGIGTITPSAGLTLQNPAANQPILQAKSNDGTERLTILETGNVGIGIANPLIPLHVSGDAGAEVLGITEVFGGTSAFGVFMAAPNANTLGLFTNQAERLRIASNGKVSIGDTSNLNATFTLRSIDNGMPTFQVKSQAGVQHFVIADDGKVGIGTSSPTAALMLQNPNASQPILQAKSSTGTERLTILENGNVGISTANPLSPLQVSGDAGAEVFGITQPFDGTSSYGVFMAAPAGNTLGLFTNNTERLRIASDGNVGIGTASPGERLHVSGNILGGQAVRARGGAPGANGASNNGFAFSGNSGDNDSGLFSAADGRVSLFANNGEYLRVTDNGIFLYALPFGDHKDLQWNSATGEVFYDNSSARYKENITPLEEDFSSLLQLQSVRYTRPGSPERWEVGFIAEQADDLGLTRLVEYDAEGKPDGFNYQKTVTYLVPLLREQRAEIETLKAQVAALTDLIKNQRATASKE